MPNWKTKVPFMTHSDPNRGSRDDSNRWRRMIDVEEDARAELQQLLRGLTCLDSDRPMIDPPNGLAQRTCESIRALRSQQQQSPAN